MGSDVIWWPSFCGNHTPYDAFWDPGLTIFTYHPVLTRCFQATVLTWIPCLVVLIFLPLYLANLIKMENKVKRMSLFNILKMTLTLALLVTAIASFSYEAPKADFAPSDYFGYVIRIVALLAILILMPLELLKGLHSTGFLFFFWLSHTICEAFIFYSTYNKVKHGGKDLPSVDEFFYRCQASYFAILLLLFVLHFFSDRAAFVKPRRRLAMYGLQVGDPSAYGDSHDSAGADDWPRVSGANSSSIMNSESEPLLNSTATTSSAQRAQPTVKPCIEERAPFWSRLLFSWFGSIVYRGFKKTITFDDIPENRLSEKCEALVPLYDRLYYKKNPDGTRSSNGEHHGLGWTLVRATWAPYTVGSIFMLFLIPVTFINPQILSLLVSFMEKLNKGGTSYKWNGIFLAFVMFVINLITSILMHNFLFNTTVAGMQARSIVNAAVYRKAIRLSGSAKRQSTVGQIVNLMSVDAQKVQDFFLYLSLMWYVPLLIAVDLYFMWQQLGVSCLAGFAVLCVVVPINGVYFARVAMNLQVSQMKQKDSRFKLMNEILAGIKVLKLYAWEESFLDHVNSFRKKELHCIKYANYINAIGATCWLLTPYLVSLAAFAVYVMIDPKNILTIDKAFVTISLINILNWPLSLLPIGVSNTVQGAVSIKRIAKFLDLEELAEDTTAYGSYLDTTALEIKEGNFSWGKDEKISLKHINLQIERGSLVAVVGGVGMGKTTLVSAFLGELHKVTGDVQINGSLAFVPQQAWIQCMKLRDNILFGKEMNQQKYNGIVEACALKRDLDILPGGDETEIGEKGVNVSGGQKQRISLARACYQDEDIYLLDDPLSAVDAHVGKHIFDHVLGPNGILNDKTRILVTHGINYLALADKVVVMNDGRISEVGRYDELLQHDGEFAKFLRTYLTEEVQIEEEEAAQQNVEDLTRLLSTLSMPEGDLDDESGDETLLQRQTSRIRRSISTQVSQSDLQEKVMEDASKAGGAKLIQDETEEKGNIKGEIILSYASSGGKAFFVLVVISMVAFIAAQVGTNIELSAWTNENLTNYNEPFVPTATKNYLALYGGLGAVQAVFALIGAFAVAHGAYLASKYYHEKLVTRLLHAPMSFFDTTPLGRIMNRFSKDLDVLDANMPLFVRMWLFTLAPVLMTLVLILYSVWMFIFALVPIIIIFFVVQRLYIATARQLKRIDSVRRSPIYVHFDESVVGSTCIRAYRKQESFIQRCDKLIDESQRPWYLIVASYRWCGICMESIGALIVFFAALFVVLKRSDPQLAGLAVSYALQITTYMNALIRNTTELETYVVSVERVDEYLDVESEADWDKPETQPPEDWPKEGSVKFENYSTRYREGLDLVLKDIDVDIKHGEKIGIVGRTGAGKSSLSLALFRLIESARGKIVIDGRVCGDLGLHALRSKLSIIPQDPVIFSGTLRFNLDPFNKRTDEQIWHALEHAHLKDFINDIPEKLAYECGEGGESMSVGQRQLVCLARALLLQARILVLDEATAAVDLETDALIQNTVRTQFKDCTILTVAHRLSTVLDYDRIIVLDQGQIREFDSPNHLLLNRHSIFYSMARDAGLV